MAFTLLISTVHFNGGTSLPLSNMNKADGIQDFPSPFKFSSPSASPSMSLSSLNHPAGFLSTARPKTQPKSWPGWKTQHPTLNKSKTKSKKYKSSMRRAAAGNLAGGNLPPTGLR